MEEDLLDCEAELTDGWMHQDSKTSSVAVYCRGGKALFGLEQTKPNLVIVHIRKAMEWYIRTGIQYGLMFALSQECLGLHGVTLLCGNEIIILSAPSGTGKTTLASLLQAYCDAIVINGDFALLHPTEEGVIFEPTPFCGSSGRSLNHRFRVNRVVFLGQAKENRWRKLDGREALTRFMTNCFIPTWDREKQEAIQSSILRCMEGLQMNAYEFAPTRQAAEQFLASINHGVIQSM